MKKAWLILVILIFVATSTIVVIKDKIIGSGITLVKSPASLQTINNTLEKSNISSGNNKYSNVGGGKKQKGKILNGVVKINNCKEIIQIQYSLKDFINNIICLENGTTGCDKIKMTCSVSVYNLDKKVGGNFSINYILVSGDKKLDSRIIEKNIEAGNKSIMKAEFIEEGFIDTNNLKCIVKIKGIPKKCE